MCQRKVDVIIERKQQLPRLTFMLKWMSSRFRPNINKRHIIGFHKELGQDTRPNSVFNNPLRVLIGLDLS